MGKQIKLHWLQSHKVKQLFLEGFHVDELSIMYKVPAHVIKRYTQALKRPERI